tara:strand:- start:199 stop:1125 length:927 start_codon:yes stop_codon:yes gene_type:complete
MNIIITGPLGHIGSALLEKLTKIKNLKKVYLIDNASSNNINVLFNLNSKKIKFKFICKDLIDKKILYSIKEKIDVVIHLASITNAEQSFKFKKKIYKNNYGIFKNVVYFCIKKKVRLIHISSTSVYGIQESFVDENCKILKPQSPYADLKLLEEKTLQKLKKKLNFITFRFGTITGISKGMRFHTAVNKFCFNTIMKQKILIWNNAINQFRPYLSLDDAIKTIIFVINKNFFNGEIYNVLTNNYTVRNILNLIRKNKFKIKIKNTASPILNQNSYFVSRKKIDNLGIKLKKNIDKDVKNTLNLLKKLY